MREVTVRCTWSSVHTLEVPDDAERFASDDLEGVCQAAGNVVTSAMAELTDWEVQDSR